MREKSTKKEEGEKMNEEIEFSPAEVKRKSKKTFESLGKDISKPYAHCALCKKPIPIHVLSLGTTSPRSIKPLFLCPTCEQTDEGRKLREKHKENVRKGLRETERG